MVDDIDQERHVGFDTSDTQFLQCAERLSDGTVKCTVVCDHFYKKTIIIWKNLSACISVAAVKTDTIA